MAVGDLRVLIVDDQHTMRSITRALLHKLDINSVEEAENGEQAVEQLLKSKKKFDFIISDLHMDKGGGINFLNRLRSDPILKELGTPVILLTGETNPMLLDVARQVGATFILPKPCSVVDMGKAVTWAVGFKVEPRPASK